MTTSGRRPKVTSARAPAGERGLARISRVAARWRRGGVSNDPFVRIRDVRGMHTLGLRQDWSRNLGRERCSSSARDVRHENATYDYSRVFKQLVSNGTAILRASDSLGLALDPSSDAVGAYVSQRVRPFSALTLEAGVRYDRASHTNETIVSPDSTRHGSRRRRPPSAAPGAIMRSRSPCSVFRSKTTCTRFSPPSARGLRGIGIDQMTWNGISLRAEAYDREISHLRARYCVGSMEIYPFAEIHYALSFVAPTRARSRGIELSVDTRRQDSEWIGPRVMCFRHRGKSSTAHGSPSQRSAARAARRLVDPSGEQSVATESVRDAPHRVGRTLLSGSRSTRSASARHHLRCGSLARPGPLFSQRAQPYQRCRRALDAVHSTHTPVASRCSSMFTMCSTTRISGKRRPTCSSIDGSESSYSGGVEGQPAAYSVFWNQLGVLSATDGVVSERADPLAGYVPWISAMATPSIEQRLRCPPTRGGDSGG